MQSDTNTTAVAVLPKIYRPSGFWKIALLLCSAVAICGGGAGVLFAAVGQFTSPGSRVTLAFVFGSFSLLGIYVLLWLFRSRVLLFPDRISIEELTSAKVFSRDELAGWRIRPSSPPALVLQPKDKHRGAVKIALVFPQDDDFQEWFNALPSLDNQESETSEAEVLEDPHFGASPPARSVMLEKGKKRATILSAVSIVVSLWAIFYPRPYLPLILILAALPWVAVTIVWRSGGLFRVDQVKNDAHPSVASALLFPELALMLRAVLDFDVFQSATAVALYIAVGGVLALAIFFVDPVSRRRKSTAVAFCALALAYGYGASIQFNVLLDRSPGANFAAVVQGKYVDHGKQTYYVLELGPWGPNTKPNNLDVRKATYESIRRGDVAELTVRKGALGISWYYLTAWERPN